MAINLNPNSSIYYTHLAESYREEKKYNEAINLYTKAINLYNKMPKPDNEDGIAAYANLGFLYAEINKYDYALFYLNYALLLNPNCRFVNYDIGIIYYAKHEYKKSLYYFNKILNIDQSDAAEYEARGITYYKLGKIESSNK